MTPGRRQPRPRNHVSPAAINESNAKHYRKSAAITAYEEFPLRSHFTLGEDGWKQVADYALNWAVETPPLPQWPEHTPGATLPTSSEATNTMLGASAIAS